MKKIKIFVVLMGVLCASTNFAQKTTSSKSNNKNKLKENIILLTTDLGNIKIRLYNETPQHKDNFLKLVTQKFYDSLLFHRVIRNFMIQGGDPESKHAVQGVMLGNGDVGYTVPAEFNDSSFHKKGALAAARQGDDINPTKASSGCQFYIVQGKIYTDDELNMLESRMNIKFSPSQRQAYKTMGGTPFLDHNYTVFGEVIEGLDVVDKIAVVQTLPGDRPAQDVRMKISIVK